ncbi:MAG: glycerophosphodiester phosphodiesterase family protein [Candidatus Hydrogenedentes bacterium]|nr:glycerophosphodiester phosphodiesterase family protein [Candidatus Hydrogenedentota bacterium]
MVKRKKLCCPKVLNVAVLICFLICLFLSRSEASSSHKQVLPPPKNGGIYVIAHRGFHKGYPENTLIAYKKAIELGVDFIEVDLRTTRDGEIVSIHNSTVDSYTKNFKGSVSDFTLAELKEMDIGSRVKPEFEKERIPTLDEILELVNGKAGLYIDMKSADPEKVLSKLESFGMKYNVVWYGGIGTLQKVKKLCSDCFIMPDPGPFKHLEYILNEFNPPVVSTDLKWCSEAFVKMCHQRGCLVFIDVLEDGAGEEEWERVIEWGVDGIQTDDPDLLIEFLKNRNCNKEK